MDIVDEEQLSNEEERLRRQMDFCLELDKEKFIKRQTYLSDKNTKENDAEHAWHMAVMALVLQEYSNQQIDLLRTISMILIHDVVEIDAGDTYAYDEEGKRTQRARELIAANRIFGMLPENQQQYFFELWEEFEERRTPEARFARAMDNIQPLMLNASTDGRSWREHETLLSSILKRNEITPEGSEKLWSYACERFIQPNVEQGNIISPNKQNLE